MELAGSITAKVVALAIIVLVIVAAALPAVSQAQEEQKSIEQNTDFRYNLEPTTGKVTVTYDSATGGLLLNGEDMTTYTPDIGDGNRLLLMFDKGVFYANYVESTNSWNNPGLAILDESRTINSFTMDGYVEFDNGTYTMVENDATVTTGSYSWLMVPNNEGTIGAFKYVAGVGLDFYIDSGKMIYIFELSSQRTILAYGTVDDVSTEYAYSNTTPTQASITFAYQPTENDASNHVTDASTTGVTINSGTIFLYPVDYTTITDLQNQYAILLSIIPVLLILVPVMVAVRMLGAGRN